MRMTYIAKVQANLRRNQVIKSRRNSERVLDGSFKSLFKGRSMNFDELREYVQGDEVKDIDWKASARSQKILVRQYIAEKKHNIMLVMDTNCRMLGDSDGLEEKRELAILGAGTMAYFAEKNGDFVGATYMSKDSIKHFPFKTGLGNIELILESYHRDTAENNKTDINDTLDYILRNFKQSMLVLIVSDIMGLKNISEEKLKHLLVKHDILCLNVSDAALGGKNVYMMDKGKYASPFFTKNKRFANKTKEMNLSYQRELTEKLKRFGIPCQTIDYAEELDHEIIQLIEQHKLMTGMSQVK